jgi:hypothetical protein
VGGADAGSPFAAAIFLSVAAPLFPNLRLACYKAVVSRKNRARAGNAV